MSGNPDAYYLRPEVSNSDLTALKELLHPRLRFGNREEAFRFGSLVDAGITRVEISTINQPKINELLLNRFK